MGNILLCDVIYATPSYANSSVLWILLLVDGHRTAGTLKQCFSNFFLVHHCHNTKHVHVPLSQYKTCPRTTVTIQNTSTYHWHNTKHVHVPLAQYKTCPRTTGTIQNMYTYHWHNTKHVHVPLAQ